MFSDFFSFTIGELWLTVFVLLLTHIFFETKRVSKSFDLAEKKRASNLYLGSYKKGDK